MNTDSEGLFSRGGDYRIQQKCLPCMDGKHNVCVDKKRCACSCNDHLNAEKVERCPYDCDCDKCNTERNRKTEEYLTGNPPTKSMEQVMVGCIHCGKSTPTLMPKKCPVCTHKLSVGKPSVELSKDEIAKRLSNPKSIEDVLMQCGSYGLGDSKYIADAIRTWLRENESSAMGEDEIENILKGYITHILWYHDKECGRTEDVAIIFASRIKQLAHAIAERMKRDK